MLTCCGWGNAERHGWIWFAQMCLNMLILFHFVLRSISWIFLVIMWFIIGVFAAICHMFSSFSLAGCCSYLAFSASLLFFSGVESMTTTQGKVKNTKRRKRRPRSFCTPLSANRSLIWKMLNWKGVGNGWMQGFIGGWLFVFLCFCKNWLWIRTGWCLSLLELPWHTGASCESQQALTDRAPEISWNSLEDVEQSSSFLWAMPKDCECKPLKCCQDTRLLWKADHVTLQFLGVGLERIFRLFQWPAFAISAWRFHTSKPAFHRFPHVWRQYGSWWHPQCNSITLWWRRKKRWLRHWCSRCGHEWTHLCQQYPECPRALGRSCHLLRNVMRDCQTMARTW